MIESIKDIINDVLTRMEDISIPNTAEARNIVFETGVAESGYRHLEQIGGGPGISFWQLEIGTVQDIWENFILYRKPYIEAMYKLGLIEDQLTFSVLTNIALASAFCRLHYRRQPGPIPGSLPGRAAYWKKYYNGPGKGTVDHYIGTNMDYLDPGDLMI